MIKPNRHKFPIKTWKVKLENHPNKSFRSYILEGLENGFDIKVKQSPVGCRFNRPVSSELKTTMLHWVERGLEKGYLIGPFKKNNVPIKNLIYSPFSAIEQDNKIRPILNNSAPQNNPTKLSVNDAIEKSDKTVQYIKIKEIVRLLTQVGKGAYLWTADCKDAYLIVNIREKDMRYMGFEFMGFTFISSTLMFGLATAPKIYTDFSDAVEYIINNEKKDITQLRLLNKIIKLIRHYLDDFFGAHKSLLAAKQQLAHCLRIMKSLNIPIKTEKIKGPGQRIQLLGWIFDTNKQIMQIPEEKIVKVTKQLELYKERFKTRQKVTINQLKSTYGLLRWAFNAIYTGESLLLSLHKLIYQKNLPEHHYVRLSSDFIKDCDLISSIIKSIKNGISFKHILNNKPSQADIYVDASLAGLGGYTQSGKWFYYNFSNKLHTLITKRVRGAPDIQTLELAAIVVAVDIWKDYLRGKYISIYTDNEPVEHNVRRWNIRAHRTDKLYLLKILSCLLITYDIKMTINGIRSKLNKGADLLSRYEPNLENIKKFKEFAASRNIVLEQQPTQSKKKFITYLQEIQRLRASKPCDYLISRQKEFFIFRKIINKKDK